ncbi:MAG: ABC transporter permease [Deltaproteobacteria bacterium]|nr:ABC transporter permease [Deltaproteobacteria bacterium]
MAYEQIKVKTPFLMKFLPVVSVTAFFLAWEMIIVSGIVPRSMLESPTAVVKLFFVKLTETNPDGFTWTVHAWTSIQEAFTGYLLSLLIGIPLGLFMGWFRTVEGLASPIFEMLRPIPSIAWISLTIYWFGIGLSSKVFIITMAGFIPCVINSYYGVKMTRPVLIQMARTYGASDWTIFKKICIPSALPMVFGALQIALATCWTTLVAAELIAANAGLGFLITMGRKLTLPGLVVLGMVSVGLTGAVIGVIIDQVEKRLLAGIRR